MTQIQNFKNLVALKFQLYNSLFTSLPFDRIEKTGILLSLFLGACEEGYENKNSPTGIITDFFSKHTTFTSENEMLDVLFQFIQYVERQVVLFDAVEDSAFKYIHDLNGEGTLKQLVLEAIHQNKEKEIAEKLHDFSVKIVLTAHPTQFYPGPVLGIISDLSRLLAENNTAQINMYLQQLGKTPFLKKEKPSPYDEAMSLIWYMENVFYPAAGNIVSFLNNHFPEASENNKPVISLGFWPGGDRDGNPFVTADTTLKVAEALRGSIIKCYYLDIRKMRRRLTFKGVDVILKQLENSLYENIFIPGKRTLLTKGSILDALNRVKQIIIEQHNNLFLHLVINLINKVEVFGLHFASLDIRQDSSVHEVVMEHISENDKIFPDGYKQLSEEKKISFLTSNNQALSNAKYENNIADDTIKTMQAVKLIQEYNGVEGCHRYVISHSNSALSILEVFGLFILSGWKKDDLKMDIVPLFETIEDLKNAPAIMETLYRNDEYISHLKRRKNCQTVMVGFSDGTKDGGYLSANWSIYKAKENLTALSKRYNIDIIFFDGRGGPPARGGGKTHQFYASLGKNISGKEIQLTIQGQTVSSNFGTIESAQFNLEQLIHAGISNVVFADRTMMLEKHEEQLLQELSDAGLNAYNELKEDPAFLEYLAKISPLNFYSETNIASRPTKRSNSKLNLDDLRAIPFVGAWSQLKQNVPGFYGVGAALQEMEKRKKFEKMQQLYKNSLFFKTLIDNCEMAMKKCFFPLTEYLSIDPEFGNIWNKINNEFNLTKEYLSKLTGKDELMEDYPVELVSISMRERIVVPLLTIQQFALSRIREISKKRDAGANKETYEKLVIRSSFGIINAGRNSA